jgi:trans-2-enoyl-CoA reductase
MPLVSAILLDSSSSSPRYERVELPPLKQGETLVRMLAASINPADINTIEGKYPSPYLGREGVGVVATLGPDTKGPAIGTRVLFPPGAATWCEAANCAVDELVCVPDDIDTEQAAVIRINPGTALLMLRDFVKLEPGEWVIQNASNSAVGRAVIQLAHAMGLRTINLVRRPELIPELKAEGADFVLLDDASASDEIKKVATPRLGLNAVGGESALRLANALADGGTLVTYGAMGRQPLRIPNGLLIFRDVRFVGFWYTQWTLRSTPAERVGFMDELLESATRKVLRTPIEKTYPLREWEAAIAHARKSGRSGKILFVAE